MTRPIDTSSPLQRFVTVERFAEMEQRLARTDVLTRQLQGGVSRSTVSALPGSPFDGQEILFQTAAMATAGVIWALRYRTATAKWEFIGGAPLHAAVATQETTSSNAYAALATAGPSITLPLVGTYDITVNTWLFTAATAGNAAYMSYDLGSTAANDLWGATLGTVAAVVNSGAVSLTTRQIVGAAQLAIVSKYRSSTNGQVITALRRRLIVTPVVLG